MRLDGGVYGSIGRSIQTGLRCMILAVLSVTLSSASEAPSEPPITAADRSHWSFQPPVRPALPHIRDVDWPRNSVDVFILARLEREGLQPMPEADRITLVRRVSFDLTGLPPTAEEVDQFVNDSSPNAYERLVERLLGSTAYGERWAQHWLDLARFAETDGFEHDYVRPNAWRYRDWVIDALNADLPYDEFVRLQLAGDELRPDDPAAAIATGFLLSGPDMPDLNLQDERRHNFLNEMTATVGSVFLGLQVGCAQCHDHKYDPVSQYDFYRLRAFFESAEFFKDHPLPTTDNRQPSEAALGRVMREASGPPKPSYLMLRGDFRRPGPDVQPAFLRVLDSTDSDEPAAEQSRRVALAEWLTQPHHPLTARVMVNRVWMHHFGEGLVRSPSDFGVTGDPPTHPELLDWLATEWPSRGWSLKELHRLLVTSATYRQASRPMDDASLPIWKELLTADPPNELLGRMARRRLEGEALRDAMLSAAGRLNHRAGGPGVRPPLDPELVKTLLKNQWPVSPDAADHRRRGVYLFARRNLRYPLFEVFDRPDPIASCPKRSRSTIAPQALTLLNSEFSLSTARDLADLAHQQSMDAEEQIQMCYRRTLGRSPATDELARARRFIRGREAGLEGLTDLCLVLFNLNEFLYID